VAIVLLTLRCVLVGRHIAHTVLQSSDEEVESAPKGKSKKAKAESSKLTKVGESSFVFRAGEARCSHVCAEAR
jgi:hypothetical protein